MACNGMASPFFPPNFLLQMQTAAAHPDDDHHHHHNQYQHHTGGIPSPAAAAAAYGASAPPGPPFQTAPQGPISPHDYHALGVGPLAPGKKSVGSLSGPFDPSCGGGGGGGGAGGGVDTGDDELSDDCSQAGVGEKKRRLNVDQVRTLERSFELGNKLEPERKMQLARALGLQPRQIAIWFQNRRARWKTKKLEKDYDALKRQYDAVRSENDALQAHNKKLQAEIIALKGRDTHAPPPEPINLNKETEGSSSNRSDNSSADVHLDISRPPPPQQTQHIDSPPPPPPPQPQQHHLQLKPSSNDATRAFFASMRPGPPHQQLIHAPMPCRPDPTAPLHPKMEPHTQPPHDESFCSMFCSIDDHSAFWAGWPDNQAFH